jgi:hypothetical protein
MTQVEGAQIPDAGHYLLADNSIFQDTFKF